MKAVDRFIAEQTDTDIRELLLALRIIICKTLPQAEESLKWKIPFYSYKGMLCYLNPKKKEVQLGFVYGIHLSNASGALTGDGKQVRHIKVKTSEDIPQEAIIESLIEAASYNERRKRK